MKTSSARLVSGLIAALVLGLPQGLTAQAKADITVVAQMFSAQMPNDKGEIFAKLEKATGLSIKVDYVPKANYKDKVNVMIASNQLPMVTVVDAGQLKENTIVNLARAGGFWTVDPTFAKYPNLKAFYAQYPLALANTKIDGKLFGLPRPRPVGRTGLVYRADWFQAIGLKAPTTAEEFVAAAKALAAKDPDKNGKADTIGYLYADISTGSYGWNGIENLTVALGGPNVWGIVNGKFVPDIMTKEYVQALSILRKLYQEKLLNQDFILASGAKRYDAFNRGVAGMYFGTLSDPISNHKDLFELQPTAKLAIAPALSGPKGQRVNATPGHNGLMMFSRNAIKTEKDLDKVLSYYDKLVADAQIDLFLEGIEGIHYTVVAGKRVVTPDQRQRLIDDLGDFVNVAILPAIQETSNDSEIVKTVNAALKANEKLAVPNPADPLVSPTAVQLGSQLDKLMQDARIKFVMGELDEAGFQAKVQEWRTRGGDKIIAEYTDLYQQSLKN